MSTKKASEKSLTKAPLTIFADQPSAVQMGPYVTKFTLGVVDEEESGYPTPVVTIAMPTTNLMRMVEDLHAMFSDPEFKKDSMKMLATDAKKFFGVVGHSKDISLGASPKKISKPRVARAG